MGMPNTVRISVLAAGAAGCVLAPPLMLAGVDSPLRVVATLLLLGVAPGAALLPSSGSRTAPVEIGLVVGLSVAVSALVAQAMLTLHLWSPAAATWVVAAACIVPIGYRLRAIRRQHAEAGR